MQRVIQKVDENDRRLRRLLLLAMSLGFLALIGAGVAAWDSVATTARYNTLVDHSYQVRAGISEFQIALEKSETARRGYLLAGQPMFLDTYRSNAAALTPQLDSLVRETADNPVQTAALAKVRRSLVRVQASRDRSMDLVARGRIVEALSAFDRDGSIYTMRALRMRLSAIDAREVDLLRSRAAVQKASASSFLALLGGAGILVIVVAVVSLVTVLRFTRDLGESSAKLATLNESLEDQVSERTTDLSRANDEIQRFAYIVSHDLRSPLVNVMGFTAELETGTKAIAELVDRAEEVAPDIVTDEARFAAREDLPEAIGFIRTSTEKMDRLINAILRLSREGRRVITPEPVDMVAVVDNIRDTLQHRLDELDGAVLVSGTLPGITSDRLAIEQVLGNVIENAVKYRNPARPIRVTVTGHVAGARAIFDIADNGRGIDPRDHARVFDLFRRSGTQDQPGEGIGLAHVRALTYRLGGTIDVASTLGEGATFRINLPVKFTETSGLTT
ncbi:CHASE3 domain-containing protein [Sphingomonas donggukensis]|uniref:histidine kinase n=1 Tax=Sphingomonas donggukensis TaxID=2949093 RepID=A0ABY4TSY1_9SPHN|nr:sensor histidine kinase [Sphingomonas donggukensis]URW74935.1 CHASE3 domain-containing protein [Sphingomonas donggukensis]